jgi:hypothetical protein
VVRRQRRVRKRGRVRGIESVERDEQPGGGDDEVLGKAAVAAETASASFRGPLAQVLLPEAAAPADAAAPGAVDEHVVAHGDAACAVAQLDHSAGHLVAERERQVVGERARRPVHEVEIRVTQAGTADAKQHLTGAGRRVVHVAQLSRLQPLGQSNRLHPANTTNLKSGW